VARPDEELEGRDPTRITRDTYDRIAPQFLAKTRRRELIGDEFGAFARALEPGARVLDVGAGPGFDASALAARGFRTFAVDLSRGMLDVGRAEFPAPRAQCDMRRLPMSDGCMDGVWANASLLHLSREDASLALREFRRVLRVGGVLHVSVKVGTDEGFETSRYGAPRWFTKWTAEALDARIRAAGFDIQEGALRERTTDTWLVRLARSRAIVGRTGGFST
jgi:ubiquinone/menaquinone biosynthesis C-methylase UbiE